jgi:hypothetical protein
VHPARLHNPCSTGRRDPCVVRIDRLGDRAFVPVLLSLSVLSVST